ncbi:hypothetical protein PC114_g8538 [Phytophthora cactorum]|uniref:Peptidase A2 domain-containing protein n=1 Tax=Phytophthora cactorum TaxID=29920 RepID=A0A8T1ASV5_9STRA|nr:hypothetical protein PC115_g20729 [Phytophthora cactorum]KAG2913398.1 hypothetical protein PC114_g8538 [Phytophthora cactorum]KAG3085857.1 hypothetical protein PC122_g9476 [Phytophthora cactorum]KAG3170890.1 hypothetical protein C6341_g10655 [Phytophthora cactorum]
MPFELSIKDGALHWYRQLPRKTKKTWSLLSEAFIKYYCSQFNQSAEALYYSAKRGDKEHVCDYLNRLNGYARNAGIKFDGSGRKTRDHVKRCLETCGDRGLEKRLCHIRVTDIHELEEMIMDILKIEERTTSREPTQLNSRSREHSRRREKRRHEDSRGGYGCRERRERDYGRRRDDSRNQPRVTLAETMDDEAHSDREPHEARGNRSNYHPQRYADSSDESGYGSEYSQYVSSDQSDAYRSDGTSQPRMTPKDALLRTTPYGRSESRTPRGDGADRERESHYPRQASRDDRYQSRNGRDGRRQYGPCAVCGGMSHSAHYCRKRCKLCKQMHDAGNPPTEAGLVPIGLPQLAAPAQEAECIYAFVGECKWPETERNDYVNATGYKKERGEYLGGGEMCEMTGGEAAERTIDDWVASAVQVEPSRILEKEVRLLLTERLGWWSKRKYDRKIRMRTLIYGAINDSRTRILLDTGANISVVSERYAKRLQLRDIPDHGRRIEVHGITQGKTAASRRASVKITLGWKRVYVFDVWFMDHNAGVDAVLGTDFMIPAGVRLDLFNAAAKLPGEVMITLIKTQNMIDEHEGRHIPGGPTDKPRIQSREYYEFSLQRHRPSPAIHVVWVKRTEKLVPTVTKFRRGNPVIMRLTNISDKVADVGPYLHLVM